MKAKNQNKLTCPDKENLLGLDVYFNYNKIYVVTRKSIRGSGHRPGTASFKQVIYREDREPGITGIARINGQVKSQLFLEMFNSVKTIEKDGELYLVALSIEYTSTKYNKFTYKNEDDTSSEQIVSPDLIQVNKECKHILERVIAEIPEFFSKEYDVPKKPITKNELVGSFLMPRYPFNTHWKAGSPEQMLVVKHLSEK